MERQNMSSAAITTMVKMMEQLVAAARKVKQEIAEGKATPL